MKYEIVKKTRWAWDVKGETGNAEPYYIVMVDGKHYAGAIFKDLETARACVTDYLMHMDDEEVVEVING
jgi:hypothetical protein